MSIRMLSSGESHGKGYLIIVEGLPAGLPISKDCIEEQLARRRRGYGRGERMKLERDEFEFYSGVRGKVTTGNPIGVVLRNSEWEKWKDAMDAFDLKEDEAKEREITRPRPGHADASGMAKFGFEEARNVLERTSARTTAAWTIAGTLCRRLLEDLGVAVRSSVTSVGPRSIGLPRSEEEWTRACSSDMGLPREEDEEEIMSIIDEAKSSGDSLGGTFAISVKNVPAGIGSYSEWDRRLDGRLAQALMAIPSAKGVEIGGGFGLSQRPGSEVHDEFVLSSGLWTRRTNNAGGIEGGVTNGEELTLHVALKPIPTLKKPLRTFDVRTKRETSAHVERGDVCVVPAASVVGEAMTSLVLAQALCEQFGDDRMEDLRSRFEEHTKRTRRMFHV